MAMKTYRVRGIDLDHDEKRYNEGSYIELDEHAAARLRRWLEPVASAAPLSLEPVAPTEPPKQEPPVAPAKAAKGKAEEKTAPANPATDTDSTGTGAAAGAEGDKQ